MPLRTNIMAILNITPDSFSDGGRLSAATIDAVLQAAQTAVEAGAACLDVGGESTRPGAKMVPAEEETVRVVPVIRALKEAFPDTLISIDTRKAAVAQAAVEAGAGMINDVSGLCFDPELARVAAINGNWLVIMHSQGTPETMQDNPCYPHGVVDEVSGFLARQAETAIQAGVAADKIVVDPGFGFGKTLAHNLTLLTSLHRFYGLGYPVLIGPSRKSFLTLGDKTIAPQEREALTAACLAMAVPQGVSWVRVHDVAAQAPALRFIETVTTTTH